MSSGVEIGRKCLSVQLILAVIKCHTAHSHERRGFIFIRTTNINGKITGTPLPLFAGTAVLFC